jgi:hypothetical protein
MGCIGNCESDIFPPTADCSGHQLSCGGNQTGWVDDPLVVGATLVKASHIVEMQNALTAERTDALRRGLSAACGTNCSDAPSYSRVPAALTDVVLADDYNDIANEDNATEYNVDCPADTGAAETPAVISALVSAGTSVITKSSVDALRADINQIEFACICASACTCNTNCGCNGECVNNVPY